MNSTNDRTASRTEVIDLLNDLYSRLGPVKPAHEMEEVIKCMHREIFILEKKEKPMEGQQVLPAFAAYVEEVLPDLKAIEETLDSTEIKKRKLQFINHTRVLLSDYLR